MYSEEELLPISGLQHVIFCERRAALIFLEGIWDDNIFTAEGTLAHDRVHNTDTESRGDIRITRGLRLNSFKLGLTGIADVVEFHKIEDEKCPEGVSLDYADGLWYPYIIEYKSGKLRHESSFEVQLCAQAICLEEMLETNIPSGSIYYGKTARRREIHFDDRLRTKTREASVMFHEIIERKNTPKAKYGKKCDKCSMISKCLPKTTGVKKDIQGYIMKSIKNDWLD